METRNLRKTRQGVVISNKMDKIIVIAAKFKQKTAYEIVPCDWSSDVCSSDLRLNSSHTEQSRMPSSA